MSAALESALHAHRAGRLDEAARQYDDILAADPLNADAWQFLGLVLLARGQVGDAVAKIGRAVALKPDAGVYHFNFAIALKRQGDISGAVASYRRAIERDPQLVEALLNLGNTLREQGELAEAIALCRRAAALRPDSLEAQISLSAALRQAQDLPEAEDAARRAVALASASAAAQDQLGNVLEARGDMAGAEAAFRAAAQLDPRFHIAQFHLASLLAAQDRRREAADVYRGLVAHGPDNVAARARLARVLAELDAFDEATTYGKTLPQQPDGNATRAGECVAAFVALGLMAKNRQLAADAATWFGRAAGVAPDDSGARFNFGLALQNHGRLREAMAEYRRALQIDPALGEARRNLAVLLQVMGAPGDAITLYREGAAARPHDVNLHRYMVGMTHYDPSWDNRRRFAAAREFDGLFTASRDVAAWPRGGDPERRLRIGYVTSDFRDHPVGRNIEPLLANRNRARFDVAAYVQVATPDAMTDRLRAMTDIWRSTVGLSDAEAAAQIRADRIDVLVFLAGHFDDNRLSICAWKPAPIQVSHHDITTSGAATIDYLIADRVVSPHGGDEGFSERVVRLPCVSVYPAIDAPAPTAPPVLRNGFVTFGCFNNPAKLSQAALLAWARILSRVPDARLRLKYQGWYQSPDLQERIVAVFRAAGVDPGRLDFRHGAWTLEEHLAAYHDVDISLDPFPFTGATASFEALWMGAPVVTLCGDHMSARWSASFLRTLKLHELVASDVDEYVGIAVGLAGDRRRLEGLRAGLRARLESSSLCDGALRARQLERVYRALWRRRCAAAP